MIRLSEVPLRRIVLFVFAFEEQPSFSPSAEALFLLLFLGILGWSLYWNEIVGVLDHVRDGSEDIHLRA